MSAPAPTLIQQAAQHLQKGEFAAARPLLERILAQDADHPEAAYLLAITEQSLDRTDQALALFRKLLKQQPRHGAAHYNLALLLGQAGKPQEALPHHEAAVELMPQEPWAWINRGNALAALGGFPEAIANYDRALTLHPKHPEALLNKGHALHELKQWAQALACYESAMGQQDRSAPLELAKARTLVAMRRFGEGLQITETLIPLAPRDASAWCLKGLCHFGLDQFQDAVSAFSHALELQPEHAESWCGLGQAQQALDQDAAACQSLRRALELRSAYVDALVNLGSSLQHLNDLDAAQEVLRAALALAPEDASAHWNLGLLLLRQQSYRSGWEHMEYRWQVPELQFRRINTTRPTGAGAASEHSLLLWGEQGIGDQILYASILPELARLPQRKLVALDKRLLPLFERSMPGFEFIDLATVSDALDFAEQLPLGSLPRLFRPDLASFAAARHPFLQADPARTAALREQIARPGKRVCGVSWSSNRKGLGKHKSISLAQMLAPLACDTLHFVDLQYGDTAAERHQLELEHGIAVQHVDEVDNFNDIDGLAALIQACDIVLTTSNSTAHLAGALGKETWLLLPLGRGRMWYWLEVEGRAPWYPSIRPFTQTEIGDWSSTLAVLQSQMRNLSAIAPS